MGGFPLTRNSVVAGVRSADREVRQRAFGSLVTAYWKPVYKYLRIRWRQAPEDAQDVTQEFFAQALEKDLFDSYNPLRARFRTYLRMCLDGHVANRQRAARRQKRGGGTELLPLAFVDAEGELRGHEPPADVDLDAYFHHEWVRHVFGLALATLERECTGSGKPGHFALFKRYHVDGGAGDEAVSYAMLAEERGLPLTQVTNHLAWARRAFRRIVLTTLREATGSEEEFRAAVRDVLGGRER